MLGELLCDPVPRRDPAAAAVEPRETISRLAHAPSFARGWCFQCFSPLGFKYGKAHFAELTPPWTAKFAAVLMVKHCDNLPTDPFSTAAVAVNMAGEGKNA